MSAHCVAFHCFALSGIVHFVRAELLLKRGDKQSCPKQQPQWPAPRCRLLSI